MKMSSTGEETYLAKKIVRLSFLFKNKPIGASPGRDYEDGISTKNLVLNILWCRAGNYIEKGGERSAGYGLIESF